MLKGGGAFARFANHPFRSNRNPALTEEIDAAYRRYYYPFHNATPTTPKAYTAEAAKHRAQIAEKYGFTDIQYAMFYRTRTFSAEEYIQLLSTYSDHIAIDEPIRTKFFSEIKDAINRHGGILAIYDTIDLQLARKP